MIHNPKDYEIFSSPLNAAVNARQSFWESALETTINIASGFIVSYLVWIFLIPIFWPEHSSSYSTAFGIVILFTITSFLRSLIWRRFFNAGLHKVIHKLVKRSL